MKIITKRDAIRKAISYWKTRLELWDVSSPLEVGFATAIGKLDPDTASADDVARVTGNTTWTDLQCSECGQFVEAVVEIGEDDYETDAHYICKECLQKAVEQLR